MIQQQFEFVTEGDKMRLLSRLLEREMDGSRILARIHPSPCTRAAVCTHSESSVLQHACGPC